LPCLSVTYSSHNDWLLLALRRASSKILPILGCWKRQTSS
jgi:hypothetical protein